MPMLRPRKLGRSYEIHCGRLEKFMRLRTQNVMVTAAPIASGSSVMKGHLQIVPKAPMMFLIWCDALANSNIV